MQGHRHFIVWLTIILVTACTAQPAPETTTTSPAETTTSGIRSPFLDVVTEPSNFEPGAVVDVVGLPVDDLNWVGSFPSDDVEFFGRLWEFDRLDAGFVALGEAARYQDGEVWEQFESDDGTFAYFPQDQTGVVGEPTDITADVSNLEGGSADELITLIAETIAAENGLEPIQITRREFGGREVYYDLIGGDDARSRGLRVRIVVEEAGEIFTTSLVEQSPICVAAIDDSGNCK